MSTTQALLLTHRSAVSLPITGKVKRMRQANSRDGWYTLHTLLHITQQESVCLQGLPLLLFRKNPMHFRHPEVTF